MPTLQTYCYWNDYYIESLLVELSIVMFRVLCFVELSIVMPIDLSIVMSIDLSCSLYVWASKNINYFIFIFWINAL